MKTQPKLFVFNDNGNRLYFPSERQLKRFIQCYRKAKLTNIVANSIIKDAQNEVVLPWSYFDDPAAYIALKEKERVLECQENAKKAADERLAAAKEELRLEEEYQKLFGDT